MRCRHESLTVQGSTAVENDVVSHYRIRERLGEGGMGIVFRAEDTRLGRAVALKFLPDHLVRNPQALDRFRREARAASALEHPNICVVHDIDEHEGRPFIALELLEGETLKQRIGTGPLPVDLLLDLGIQIADALDAAHEKGILHRDIKPSNIFVTARGQAKVLDFGLAKLPETDKAGLSSLPTASGPDLRTSPGTVMGTIAYMSPEQARGWPLDARSDIFSFGAVLYEMATGRPPFDGRTAAVLFDAILNHEPPAPSLVNPGIPGELSRITLKALEKDRELRFQTTRDLLGDLRRLRRDTGSGRRAAWSGAPPVATPARSVSTPRRKRRRLVQGALVLLGLAVWGLWPSSSPAPPGIRAYVQLTSDRVRKLTPVTDGPRVYFTEMPRLDRSVLVQVASAGGEVAPLSVPLASVAAIDVSPDGSQILVGGAREAVGTGQRLAELWMVPVVGGAARRLGTLAGTGAAWSPDGSRIAYTVERDLRIASADGSGSSTVWTAGALVSYPAWSPDGRRLRVTVTDPSGERDSLWEVGADGRNPHALLSGFPYLACCGRFTGNGDDFVFQVSGVATVDLWLLPEGPAWPPWRRRSPTRLTHGPLDFFGPVPSRDGRGLFALGTRRSGELVRYDARAGQFLPWLGGPSIVGLDFSADGRWVTYVGLPDGILWRARADLSDRRQLTFPPRLAALPRFSPDGSRIAFSSTSPGEPSRIQVIAAEGGVPETVAPSDRSEVDVSWSPDGESLAFGLRVDLDRPDRPLTIEIVDLKTRRTAPVPGSERLFSPRWSPDGRCLAALSHDSRRLLLFDFQAGAWRELLSGEELIAYPAWSRDGRHLFVNVGPSRFRVRVVDGLRNEVASFQELRQANGPYGEWVGQGPDDSILALRDTSIQEIFALEWEQAK
jgi:hypothetical protein